MDEHRLDRRIAALIRRLGERGAPRVTEVDATERIAVWAEVDALPGPQRQVVYLRYQADLPFEDVASVMGITPGAARSLSSQALTTLRSRLRVEGQG
jgi:RNA polymerase sigma-70 factor (ECF subfamily)